MSEGSSKASLAVRARAGLKENLLNLVLCIPLIVAGVFMLSPDSYSVSLTLIWSMTGIVIGFFISHSDSRDELISGQNMLSVQMMLVNQMINMQNSIGLMMEQTPKYLLVLNALSGEIDKLQTKIKKTTQQKEVMRALLTIYLIMAIFITILPLFSRNF